MRPINRWRWWLCAFATIGALAVGGATTAHAFCGFYVSGADAKLFNNATMVVMMRQGTRTVLSMQNNYQGPPENFALVVPVPQVLSEDNVVTLPPEVFDKVDALAAPRLVEYWELDPCFVEPEVLPMPSSAVMDEPSESGAGPDDLGVTVEAEFVVGEYQIVILGAKDAVGLDKWLRLNEYQIPDGVEPVLRPYVEGGMKFFVAKVDVSKVTMRDGMAQLSPLRFHYDSKDFSLPVRLGLLNSAGKQDLIVHILSSVRYEVANYPNVTIPTNIDVADSVRTSFGEFYAALFDSTLEKNRGAVVTEYAWDASTCDPCPTPPLDHQALMTLGADVLYDAAIATGDRPTPPGAPSGAPRPPPPPRQPPSIGSFVLTRLHARYGADQLGEDLVFKEARAIAGGREVRNNDGTLEHGSVESYSNNFQGRYAIRHEWTGAITCDNPRRGRWGGPPNGGGNRVEAAEDLAFAKRGELALASVVRQDIPELGVVAAATTSAGSGAGAGPTPTPKSKKKGCGGCAAGGDAPVGALVILGAAVALAIGRRRARG